MTMRQVVFCCGLMILCSSAGVWADGYEVTNKAAWEEWTYPKGVVAVTDEGSVRLLRIRRDIDAVSDAHQFVHKDAKGSEVRGGIRAVGSNPGSADRLIDGNPDTWWEPDRGDDLEDWWIEVDLGRVVAASRLRLTFYGGVSPPEQFSIYTSNGVRLFPGSDILEFAVVGRTTKPNVQHSIEYELAPTPYATAGSSETLEYLVSTREVQNVLIVLDSRSAFARLAELEVISLGDNISLGTLDRGGWWQSGKGKASSNTYDGDLGSFSSLGHVTDQDWETFGSWFEWDLGAVFWVDTALLLWTFNRMERLPGYILKTSDGSRTPAGHLDYQLLTDVRNLAEPMRYYLHHHFPPRRVRYLWLRIAHAVFNEPGYSPRLSEMQLYGEGFPAGATLVSPLISLEGGGGLPQLITGVEWEAEAPPGTAVEIRSRAGDVLIEESHYFDQGGKEIAKEKWLRTPESYRGPQTMTLKPGNDWSLWSDVYQRSGEAFLSPNPRKYAQFQVTLISDDPALTPALNALSLRLSPPFSKAVLGSLSPLAVHADQDTSFSLRLWSLLTPGETYRGFDRVLIKTPAPVHPEGITVKMGVETVAPETREVRGDSLLIGLPRYVDREVVEVTFRTRVRENGALFRAFVGSALQPDTWQQVDPAQKGATTVLLPSLPGSSDLIGQVSVTPSGITPNGDGVNDEATIRFSVFKTDKTPVVAICDLGGSPLVELTRAPGADHVFHWDGRDESGASVSPGLYICRIHVGASAGIRTAYRTIAVIY